MKKWTAFLLCLLLLLLPVTASAASTRVIDDAGLLTASQIQELENTCAAFSEEYGADLVILTADSLGGSSARAYADDFYDSQGYGENGILFLLAMAEREWYISTAGTAISALHDQALMEIEYEVVPYLSSGDYYGGFLRLAEILPYYFDLPESSGRQEIYYDSQEELYYPQEYPAEAYDSGPRVNLLVSLMVGAVIAGITLMVMRSSMNTRRAQRGAANYQTQGSYHLTQHQDLFLYSNVTKRPRPQNNPSHGSGHGGGHHSTVHRSAGGRSHGGRGGRF